RVRGRLPRRGLPRPRVAAGARRAHPLRGTAPRGLPDRHRVPRPGRQQPRDLLEHRPDRPRRGGPPGERVASGADAGRGGREPGRGPEPAPARLSRAPRPTIRTAEPQRASAITLRAIAVLTSTS